MYALFKTNDFLLISIYQNIQNFTDNTILFRFEVGTSHISTLILPDGRKYDQAVLFDMKLRLVLVCNKDAVDLSLKLNLSSFSNRC